MSLGREREFHASSDKKPFEVGLIFVMESLLLLSGVTRLPQYLPVWEWCFQHSRKSKCLPLSLIALESPEKYFSLVIFGLPDIVRGTIIISGKGMSLSGLHSVTQLGIEKT